MLDVFRPCFFYSQYLAQLVDVGGGTGGHPVCRRLYDMSMPTPLISSTFMVLGYAFRVCVHPEYVKSQQRRSFNFLWSVGKTPVVATVCGPLFLCFHMVLFAFTTNYMITSYRLANRKTDSHRQRVYKNIGFGRILEETDVKVLRYCSGICCSSLPHTFVRRFSRNRL